MLFLISNCISNMLHMLHTQHVTVKKLHLISNLPNTAHKHIYDYTYWRHNDLASACMCVYVCVCGRKYHAIDVNQHTAGSDAQKQVQLATSPYVDVISSLTIKQYRTHTHTYNKPKGARTALALPSIR